MATRKNGWAKPILIGAAITVLAALIMGPWYVHEARMDRIEERNENHLEHIRQDICEIREDIKKLLAR